MSADTNNIIPFVKSIPDFFKIYGLGQPDYEDIMCMMLEDQPDDKLMHMPLYRAGFFRVIHFTNANLHFATVGKEHDVVSDCLCFTYPGKLESWTRSGKLYGFVVYFSTAFSGLDITKHNFDNEYPYFNYDAEQIIVLSQYEVGEIKYLEEEMIREIKSGERDKMEMLKKLLQLYLQKVRRIYNTNVNNLSKEVKLSKSVFNRFRKELDLYVQQLVAEETGDSPTVSLLAKKLNINANYLNSIIKELTGKTASTHIQEKLLLESKALLIHTDLQVAEISIMLGFQNTSYFNRFFKKGSLVTPSEYRKQFVK